MTNPHFGRRAVFVSALAIALFVWAGLLPARAATVVTATITITNAPIGNTNTITWSGDTRTFTNSITASPSTLILETNSTTYTATNIYNHLGVYPFNAGHILSRTQPTNVSIRGFPDQTMDITIAGGWAGVTYVTNTIGTPTINVRVPYTVESSSNSTWIASQLVTYLGQATNAMATNATALSNYLQRGAGPLQPIVGPVRFNSLAGTNSGLTNGYIVNAFLQTVSNISGTISALTNGYATNLILGSPIITNGVNYGNAFSSPGTNANSEQFGASASASGSGALSVGQNSIGSGLNATAIGQSSEASGELSAALGNGAAAIGDGATALGNAATASALYSSAVGVGAVSSYQNSLALGANSATTESNQVMIGTATINVKVNNRLEVGGYTTNITFKGTNVWGGDISFTAATVSTVADGHNVVNIGTNVYVRLTGSPTTAWQLGGITGGNRNGKLVIFENATGYSPTILNESGTTPTAADRILTLQDSSGTSTNVTVPGNQIFGLIYDSSASRWKLMFPGETTTSATNVVLSQKIVSAPSDGELWQSASNKAVSAYVNGITNVLVGNIFIGTNTVTLTNSVSEFPVLTNGIGELNLPANFWTPGKTLRVAIGGEHWVAAATTMRIQAKLGSTTILDTGAKTIAYSVAAEYRPINITLTCRHAGATGGIMGSLDSMDYSTVNTFGANPHFALSTSPVTYDTTASGRLIVTITYNATASSYRVLNSTAEVLR